MLWEHANILKGVLLHTQPYDFLNHKIDQINNLIKLACEI